MDKITSVGLVSGLVSGLVGTLVGASILLGASLILPPNVYRAEVFQRGNQPTAMRMYREDAADGIYVEDSKKEGNYIKLSEYLGRIESEADRGIEEANIRKAVRWYEE